MIRLNNVGKKVWDGNQLKSILDDVTLEINDGEFISLIGESASGKTTLLSIIGLIDSASSGEIIYDNENVNKKNEKDLSEFRGKYIGYLPQNNYLLPFLNVWDNVESFLELYGYNKSEAKDKTEHALDKVGIDKSIYTNYPNMISGGEKQRVAIARLLALNPKYILADEPTGNLDYKNASKIFDLFRKVNGTGTTIIVVTHDISLASRSDKVYRIEQGNIHECDIKNINKLY